MPSSEQPARPAPRGKVALVLAGGGLTGAVYEIGALRAINDLLVDRTVNDFDMYVGTSAGALVGALLANGLAPEEMLKVLDGSHPVAPPLVRRDLLQIDARGLLGWARRVPRKLLGAGRHYLRHASDMSLFDVLWLLSEALPAGLYDGRALERYVRRVLTQFRGTNRFGELSRELCIIATDLDSGRRAVFSREQRSGVPISLAVAASAALPLLYPPVRIGRHEYVDGGLRGTASIDLAIEHGATLVICINPLVPFDNSDRRSIPFLGPDGGYLSAKGLPAIAAQVSRITMHSGLHYHIKQLRRSHPEVDIILVEPRADDYQMFFYNIMRYSARLIVARHGFESVTLDLAEDYPLYREILGRHGIPLSRRLVAEELARIENSGGDPEVIRGVLEARATRFGDEGSYTPTGQLRRALAELDLALDRRRPPARTTDPATGQP
jgi:predicted acylesterase/phospholipase RssA